MLLYRLMSLVSILVCSKLVIAQDSDGFFICQESGRPIPMDYVCDGYEDCSDGADEYDCGSAFKCESYEFQCSTADICVNMVFKCDGINHCPDGSDEKDCGLRDCKEWEYTCNNGRCIPQLYICDEYDDCGDNSDEPSTCPTETCDPQTEWACKSDGKCIAKNWRCDYEEDCKDGSDEKECTVFNHRCGAGLFNCSQTECISANKLCDGMPDCKTNTGVDEDSSICVVLDCGHNQFACPEKCLDSLDSVCNGVYDCMDGSDEIGCASSCLSTQYQCIDGHCIDLMDRCDGVVQCTDGSDEFLCTPSMIFNCSEGEYLCQDYLSCVPEMSVCDGTEQCGDGSDETICSNSDVIGENSCLQDNGLCHHNCHYINGMHYCSCNHGYIIDSRNGKSCIDVNECDVLYGVCDQMCKNTNGSYNCSCAEGFIESDEHGRCKATGSALELLFTNWYDIQQLNIRTGQLNISVSDMIGSTALDYHYRYGLMFWSDINSEKIMRSKFDGTEKRSIADIGVNTAEGIAVDWINDRIYWTDGELNRIEVANIDGTKRAILFSGLNHPKDIVVDPLNGVLFWTETQKIFKASLDGSERKEFLSDITNYISWPTGLALDLPSQTLYWVDAGTRGIGTCRTDGKHQRLLYSGNITHPFGICVFENKIYWTDRHLGGIYSINRITGKRFRKVLTDVYKPLDVVAIHPLKQPMKEDITGVVDPCSVDNGGCDYLCLVGRNAHHSCRCPSFRNLLSDKRSCSKMNLFMLFSMTDRIHVFSLQNMSRYDVEIPLANTKLSNIVALGWDDQHDIIFWADAAKKSINSASINGSSQNVLIDTDIVSPGGLAVDWISRKLYWTDTNLGRVYMSELNGSSVSVIAALDEGIATDIVVHPLKGVLYYGVIHDNNKKNFIREVHLDGTQNRKLQVFDKTIPSLLTIDYSTERLYWIDNINNRLESMFINGTDYEELLSSGILYRSKGLTVYKDHLYWTDEVDHSIHQIMKDPPYTNHKLISNRDGLRDITVFHRNRYQPAFHPCWNNNGGCSHLCIGIPSDDGSISVSCKCPTGYLLQSNEKTCSPDIDQFILFTTNSKIGYVSLDTQTNVDVTIPITPKPRSVISVDYDLRNDHIYWIEEGSASIYRAPMKGGKRETVLSVGLLRPTALAVDWLGGNLYFADSLTQRLEVCRLNGESCKVLVADNNVGEVLSIVLDLNSQYIFWSSIHPSPQIFRALTDGSNPMAIIHSTDVTYPISLAIDNRGASSKLFVADSVQRRIKMFDTDGNSQVLFTITDSPIGGLAVDGDYVYWVDSNTGILHKTNKINSDSSERININMADVSTFGLIRRTYQLEESALPLHYACNEHTCSDLCLPNWDLSRYTCACPTGIKDQTNCAKVPALYLIFTTSNSIRRLSLDSMKYHDVVLVPELEKISYIDYHLKSSTAGTIYWSDPLRHSIMSSDIDGSNVRPFLKFKKNLRGLSVDWTTGNVYYIDASVPSIEVIDQSGSFNKVIINSSLGEPVDLALLPSKGYIFWTDWSKTLSRIVRATMDGADIVTLVTLGHQKPTHLTITPNDGFLYWVDANNGTLQKIKYDGTRYEFVWRDIGRPFGVAVYEQSIFWSDVFDGAIYRCNIGGHLNQKKQQYLEKGFGTPKGVTVVTNNRIGEIDGNHSGSACGYNNGDCPYLCIPISQYERRCVCPTSAVSECVEYVGVHSWTISSSTTPPSSVHVTTTAITITTKSNTLLSISVTSTELSNTSHSGTIFDQASIVVLTLIGVFLLAILSVLAFILFLIWKYKKLPPADETGASTKTQFKITNPLVYNSLYEKTDLSEETTSKPKLKPSHYQLNNTVELQVKNKAMVDELSNKNISLKQTPKQLKPKVLNSDTLVDASVNEPPVNEPEEYEITPVQSRRHHSNTASSPPISPVGVPITVHYPTSSPAHVSVAIKPIRTAPSPTKSAHRHVKFAASVSDPPPVPPRSGRLLSLSLSDKESNPDPPPPRPPLSAPATSPPPSFFPNTPLPVVPATSPHMMFAVRNPMFGRSCSSSSENDISGLSATSDGSGDVERLNSSFASDGDIFFKQ